MSVDTGGDGGTRGTSRRMAMLALVATEVTTTPSSEAHPKRINHVRAASIDVDLAATAESMETERGTQPRQGGATAAARKRPATAAAPAAAADAQSRPRWSSGGGRPADVAPVPFRTTPGFVVTASPGMAYRSRPAVAAAAASPGLAVASPRGQLRFTRPRTAAATNSAVTPARTPGGPRTGSLSGPDGADGAAAAGGLATPGAASAAARADLDEWGLPAGPQSSAAASTAAMAAARFFAAQQSASPGGDAAPAQPGTPVSPAAASGGASNTTLAIGYALGAVVGQGGFCQVRVGTHALTGARVAVKVIDKGALVGPNDRRRVGREVRVLKRLACGAIIRLFDVVTAPANIFVVMEYADGGSLLDHVRHAGKLAEHAACRLIQQLLAGVSFCHQHGVIHRDVKLENALLDRDGNIKLIDFGLAALVPSLTTLLRVHCGSPSYAAPEIVARKPYLGPPVDLWSLGVVLFACVAGFLPFHAPPGAKNELSSKILKGTFSIPDGLSPDLCDLLKRILVVDPAKRADAEAIRQHKWMRRGVAQHPAPVPHGPPPAVDETTADGGRLAALADLGVPRDALLADLMAGETNYMTAAYHLWGCGVGGAPSGFGPCPSPLPLTPSLSDLASGAPSPGGTTRTPRTSSGTSGRRLSDTGTGRLSLGGNQTSAFTPPSILAPATPELAVS
jgi:5'-AMP-activated protein kinase catalytic alpha subunit